jgi:signal peptidase II
LVAIGSAVVLLDQATKYLTVQYFADDPFRQVQILGDWLRYIYVINQGAAFGILQGQRIVFVIAALIVVPAIFYFYRSLTNEPWYVRFSLGLLLGGALGNFIDRVRQGYVVDFIDMGIGATRWPTYNVSDSSFVVGTVVLAVYVLFLQREGVREQQAGDAAPRN